MFGVIETRELLLVPMRKLLVELEHYLRAHDTGVLSFIIELSHEDHSRSLIDVGLSSSVRDANHFLRIARERLERATLCAGVTELVIRAETFSAPDTGQRDLFDGASVQNRQWTTAVETLSARWGADAVWSLGVVADHRPENGWRKLPPGATDSAGDFPQRPLSLLPRPISRPPLLSKPERIRTGWWAASVDRLKSSFVCETLN